MGGGGFGIGFGRVLGIGDGANLGVGVVPVESLLAVLIGTGEFLLTLVAVPAALRELQLVAVPIANMPMSIYVIGFFIVNLILI
ncbi:hypothetical protein HH214_16975 [Mucilaginibacter robiniae]|uniref:Uncharacterized protein n=1 Tax=Mucilaginibacter robiniae TaxID=2728022 RepID=A0A7L5E987_9SPHI|nr:hypothetical protein [Mucilaginibacter robiniae]QJD97443.1 hypothetical protein HH214_16975 [Mucilaginibacter robiniae]